MTNDTTYNIRPATMEDFDPIHALLMPHYIKYAYDYVALQQIKESLTPAPNKEIFTAFHKNQAIGFIQANTEDRGTTGHNISEMFKGAGELQGHIQSLYVHPDHRGHGIAQKLMDKAEQWAKDQGASSIILQVDADNEKAQSLYKKRHYRTEFNTFFYDYYEGSFPPPKDLIRHGMRKNLSRDLA